ncbi:MAG: hypothetical protein ACJAVV_003471 [Alphaproteobacteria bacterium]|jgi:hypothetical protein
MTNFSRSTFQNTTKATLFLVIIGVSSAGFSQGSMTYSSRSSDLKDDSYWTVQE